jgi:hypothetical protein
VRQRRALPLRQDAPGPPSQQQQQQREQQQQQQWQEETKQQRRRPRLAASGLAAFGAAAAALAACPGAHAAGLIAEPSNALSLPTWAIHVSSGEPAQGVPCRLLPRRSRAHSPPGCWRPLQTPPPPAQHKPPPRAPASRPAPLVAEWLIAIGLFWRYAEVSGNPRWKGMSWAMLPALGSAMSACTWHFFYNSPDLDFLVAIQAGLTVVGNATCWVAAYRIYQAAKAEQGA